MTKRDDRFSLVEMRVQARETPPLVEQLEAIVEREILVDATSTSSPPSG